MIEIQPMQTPKTLAKTLGISERWAQKLCRRVLGARKFYKLNHAEFEQVEGEYHKWRRENGH